MADVLQHAEQPFHQVLAFSDNENRQRPIEKSEVYRDRPSVTGGAGELTFQPRVA